MYLLIHTMTVVENDCVLQAQFFHTVTLDSNARLVGKRVSVRVNRSFNRNKFGLKTIVKRKGSLIRHHLKTIKIVNNTGQPQSNEYIPKLDDCTVPINPQPVLQRCSSNTSLVVPENQETNIQNSGALTADSNVQQTTQWLSINRFVSHLHTFVGFSGADMLRMTKADLIQICGQADGIRLYNSLHSKSITPKLTLYVCRENTNVYHAIYLMSHSNLELLQKLSSLIGVAKEQIEQIYYQGPHGIHVMMNDDVIKHLKEESMYSVEIIMNGNSYVIVLKPIVK